MYNTIHIKLNQFILPKDNKTFISEDEDKDESSLKESVFPQLVREGIIRGDVNIEVPTLARMVKIVVASINEGK